MDALQFASSCRKAIRLIHYNADCYIYAVLHRHNKNLHTLCGKLSGHATANATTYLLSKRTLQDATVTAMLFVVKKQCCNDYC